MEQLKKQKFILHDDLFEKLRLEYEKCEYCLIDEVRLYKYYGDYRLISEEYFQRKRNSEFIIGRIYTCFANATPLYCLYLIRKAKYLSFEVR